MSTTVVPLAAATPPDLVTVSSSDPSETEVSPSGSNPGDDAGDEPSGGRGPTEDSAVAALLGLRSAWPSSPVEEHGSDGYDHSSGYGADEAQAMWEGQRTSDRRAYGFREDGPYSPRLLRGAMGYDTPDYPSPKRMRAPKDGESACHYPPSSLPAAPCANFLRSIAPPSSSGQWNPPRAPCHVATLLLWPRPRRGVVPMSGQRAKRDACAVPARFHSLRPSKVVSSDATQPVFLTFSASVHPSVPHARRRAAPRHFSVPMQVPRVQQALRLHRRRAQALPKAPPGVASADRPLLGA